MTTKNERFKIKQKVVDAYGGKCWCCGEETFEFLSIDHIDGRKPRGAPRGGTSLYSWLIKHEFPKGFRLLCLNCNLSIGFHGYCPHEKQWTSEIAVAQKESLDKLRGEVFDTPIVPKDSKEEKIFNSLCVLQPELKELLRKASSSEVHNAAKVEPRFCRNRIWYRDFKPVLCRLVGWYAPKDLVPVIRTTTSYAVAYGMIYRALPMCRDCTCETKGRYT